MANINAPKGLIPRYNLTCSDIPVNRYFIPASDSTAVAVGDTVILTGTGDSTGVPVVAKASFGGGAYITGVVVAVEAITDESTTYREASTARYVLVSDHLDTVYEVQGDSVGTSPAVTQVGLNGDLVSGTLDTAWGRSGTQLDTSTLATTNTLQVRVIGFLQANDNEIGDYARYLVSINLHTKRNLTGI